MSTFWKHIGMVFADIAHGALVAAKWSSSHPQVIAEIGTAVTAVNPVAGAIITASAGAITQATK